MGFLDGMYAICITIISLEIPNYITNLGTIASLIGIRGAILICSIDMLAYASVFFIIYELWSYHRAVVKTVSLNKRWQNLFNALIFILISILPAFVLQRIDQRIQRTVELVETSKVSSVTFDDYLLHHQFGYIPVFLLFFLSFFLIGRLISAGRSTIDNYTYYEIYPALMQKSLYFLIVTISGLLLTIFGKFAVGPVNALLLLIYICSAYRDRRPIDE